MRTKTDITIENYTYHSASVEVESFSVNKSQYIKSGTVNADIVVTEPSTGRDTMVYLSLKMGTISFESIEAKALEVLTA